MWIGLSFAACFISAVAAVYRKSGIEGQNPFWYGAISLSITTVTIFIIGYVIGDNRDLANMPDRTMCITLASGVIQGLSWLTYMLAIYYINNAFWNIFLNHWNTFGSGQERLFIPIKR